MPMNGNGKPFEIEGTIGGNSQLTEGRRRHDKMTLEFTGLRVINVENLAGAGGAGPTCARWTCADSLRRAPGRGATRQPPGRTLRNVGPRITYKLRDAAGQAREFHNYMLPVDLDGAAGVPRRACATRRPSVPLPAHAGRRQGQHRRLAAAARARSAMRGCARRRRALRTRRGDRTSSRRWWRSWRPRPLRALALFAGRGAADGRRAGRCGPAGDREFLESNVPEAERAAHLRSAAAHPQRRLFELQQPRARAGRARGRSQATSGRRRS